MSAAKLTEKLTLTLLSLSGLSLSWARLSGGRALLSISARFAPQSIGTAISLARLISSVGNTAPSTHHNQRPNIYQFWEKQFWRASIALLSFIKPATCCVSRTCTSRSNKLCSRESRKGRTEIARDRGPIVKSVQLALRTYASEKEDRLTSLWYRAVRSETAR